MKKLLPLILIIVSSLQSKAQVTLQHQFTRVGDRPMQWVYLKHSGFKYVLQHNDTLTFYNLNYSLFKSFRIPGNWSPTDINVWFISEGLFDNDTNHIEYLVESYCCPDSIGIYKEDITTLFYSDSMIVSSSVPGMGMGYAQPVFTTDSGTFLLLGTQHSNGNSKGYNIYKLGGSVPCMPSCYGNGGPSFVEPLTDGGGGGSSEVYPNPATTYTDIYYTLPDGVNTGEILLTDLAGKEVKRFTVDRQFTHLHLTTTDVAAGTYIYQLSANGNFVSAKKLVVVK